MTNKTRKPALTLIIVLAVMSLIAGVVAGLTYHSAAIHQQIRRQRLQTTARFATHSVRELIRQGRAQVPAPGEAQPLELNSFLTGGVKGTGTIECPADENSDSCEIDIRLKLSKTGVSHRSLFARPETQTSP